MTMENPEKSRTIFECLECNYITSKKNDYVKHCLTAKHQNAKNGEINPQKTLKNIACTFCNFHTHNQKDYDRHILTNKHKSKATAMNNPVSNTESIHTSSDVNLTVLVIELLKDNKELRNSILEISKNQSIINNTTTTNSNNINTNQQFNLQFFLNETCKDAMNIDDFIKSLKVTMEDFETTGKIGYVEGITRIILNGLKQIDTTKRPIHCTDLKRETVYIKNEDTWEKENQEKGKLQRAVKHIARMNLSQLPKWQRENPESEILDTKENNNYIKYSKAALGGFDDQEEDKYVNKIMKNVMKEVIVAKSL